MIKKFRVANLLGIFVLEVFLLLVIPDCNAQTLSAPACQDKKHKGPVVAAYEGSKPERGSRDAEAFKQILVLEHIETNLKQIQPINPASDIWLNLPKPIMEMDPIDCDAEYACTGAAFYLAPVEQSRVATIKNRLDELSALPMFGCYRIENDFENKQEQIRCRYVRKTTFSDSQFQGDAAKTIKAWSASKGERFTDIWVEAGVRVDSRGLPLEKLCAVRPVAAMTDKKLYLFIEQVKGSAQFAQQIIVTGQRFFSFLETTDLRPSIINVMDIFSDELAKNLKSDPLLADRSLDVRQQLGEWIFKREHQKSRVIGRESWLPAVFNSAYEISSYTFKWFSTDKREATSSTEHGFYGKGAEQTYGHNIFIEVEHVFLLGPSQAGPFKEDIEPQSQMDDYLSLYKRAVSDAFRKALRDTCYVRLAGKGMLVNGVCEIRGNVQ